MADKPKSNKQRYRLTAKGDRVGTATRPTIRCERFAWLPTSGGADLYSGARIQYFQVELPTLPSAPQLLNRRFPLGSKATHSNG